MNIDKFFRDVVQQFNDTNKCGRCWAFFSPLSESGMNATKLEDDEVVGLREYRAYLTEFDAQNMTAKIILEGDDSKKRITSEISDPAASKKNNPYLNALSAYISTKGDISSIFTITAKATVKKGQINRLFIVDAKLYFSPPPGHCAGFLFALPYHLSRIP